MTEYTPEWFAQREAELAQKLADLNPTSEQLAEMERSSASLKRIFDELAEEMRIRGLAGPLYAWHVWVDGHCTRCDEPWPCLIVREYRQGVQDGIAAYRDSKGVDDASTDGA